MRPVTFRFESRTHDRNPYLLVLYPARRRCPRRPSTHPGSAALGRGKTVFKRDPLPNEEIASVFVDAILAAGGLPLQMSITEDIEVIRHYVDIADGIAIPGGPDVNPKRWGDDRPYDPTLCCEIRDSFEFKLVGEVLRAKKPLFTTCRGTQLLNVATGGTCAWTCRAWALARPHTVAPYPRAQRPRAPCRGHAGLAAGARGWRAQADPDQLGTSLLRRSSGQEHALGRQGNRRRSRVHRS